MNKKEKYRKFKNIRKIIIYNNIFKEKKLFFSFN